VRAENGYVSRKEQLTRGSLMRQRTSPSFGLSRGHASSQPVAVPRPAEGPLDAAVAPHGRFSRRAGRRHIKTNGGMVPGTAPPASPWPDCSSPRPA